VRTVPQGEAEDLCGFSGQVGGDGKIAADAFFLLKSRKEIEKEGNQEIRYNKSTRNMREGKKRETRRTDTDCPRIRLFERIPLWRSARPT
jgi:hypothetical protein